MAKKENKSPREIDLTSFEFVTACGACHPGGGPAEYDRNGHRYDQFAADESNHIQPNGDNRLDGDYFKANWAATGVLEADCLLCHMPGYNYSERAKQIAAQNFRWAATAGAGLATVQGQVKKGETPVLTYRKELFLPSGEVSLHMVREPASEVCLNCHKEPDWKKKGAIYSERTDVHLKAGVRCVDCHVTGKKAKDARINGQEMHQIGKGDDPTGLVRKDLNNTMRTCEDCHMTGLLKAPIPKHYGLPSRHLEKIACQTCHIPQRQAKAALIQDSTVFNDVPRIEAPGKRIWTFYGPDMRPWNLYGEASLATSEHQPLFLYEPVRIWYKGRIYPMNRIYSIWVATLTKDGQNIGQPFMKDLFAVWKAHRDDPKNNYPELASIQDDNQDGAAELNRPEEIQAFLKAMARYLQKAGEDLENKDVILVSGSEYTTDGVSWRPLPFKPQPWEYTPYSSVFKLSHDILPAASALGSGGCTDCHSLKSNFWNQKVMLKPFTGPNAETLYTTNAQLLGLSEFGVWMGAIRHEWLGKTLLVVILSALIAAAVFLMTTGHTLTLPQSIRLSTTHGLMIAILLIAVAGPGLIIIGEEILTSQLVDMLGKFHTLAGLVFLAAVIYSILRAKAARSIWYWTAVCGVLFMALTAAILLFSDSINTRQIAFTLHDLGAVFLCGWAALALLFGKMGRNK